MSTQRFLNLVSISILICAAVGTLVLDNPFLSSFVSTLNVQEDVSEGADEISPKSLTEKVKDFESAEGFFDFYWENKTGKLWLKIDKFDQEFLYVHSLSTGLGSNPVGLDRGQLGGQKVVHFKRVGPKVLMCQRNLSFRASGNNSDEQNSVAQSFAQSTVWGLKVEAEDPDGSVLVDLTPLLMSDIHGVTETLKRAEQGDYSVDDSRSAIFLDRTRSFPNNTEFESSLTFTGSKPGPLVRQTTPTPKAITLRQHHSFVRLPDDNYKPRVHDPRCPSISISFADYSAPLDQSIQKRWIIRHRLEKVDPNAQLSEAVEPIVYYVDPGAPPKIQEALIEGGSWWNDAFEAAGFKNAFQVKVLPSDADPMDVRYNMIQWVHRATRGWSYGAGVIDPRTGEIIKGHVSLGSLRVRQDRVLFQGVLPATADNNAGMHGISCASGCACAMTSPPSLEAISKLSQDSDPIATSLARIRQLSAHEIGHTLGFVHNFAASTYMGRASVMDYPAPMIKVTADNRLDLSDAYDVGIGEWDIVGVRYAYSQFKPDQNESEELAKILDDAIARKMLFISDADSRPAGAAHPLSNLWDNGTDPVEELKHVMRVRRIALNKFGKSVLESGRPMSDLETLLVPVYLHHRYQVDAAAKVLGGSVYTYAVNGDVQSPTDSISGSKQRAALEALLNTIKPSELTIDNSIVSLIPPRPFSNVNDIERFPNQTGPMFDPTAAAEVAIDLTLKNIFQPQRFARLAAKSITNPGRWDADVAVTFLVDEIWNDAQAARTDSERVISRLVRSRLQKILIELAENQNTSVEARVVAHRALKLILQKHRSRLTNVDTREFEFSNQKIAELQRFNSRPNPESTPAESLKTPPGSPIGS